MTPRQVLSAGAADRRALLARHRAIMAARRQAPWLAAVRGMPLDPADQARGFTDAIAGRPRDGGDSLSYLTGFAAGLIARRG
jgi:hypothetical protein